MERLAGLFLPSDLDAYVLPNLRVAVSRGGEDTQGEGGIAVVFLLR